MQKVKIGILALCLLLSLAIEGRGALYAAESNQLPGRTLATQATDPLQILFLVGLHELQRGNYLAAIQVFESLTKQTDSPRVRLELARAFFLNRQYKAAKNLFKEVRSNPNTPYAVKENIQFYLDEIDSALGSLKFGFSIVTDSNPRNFTDSRQVMIAGQVLTLIPPKDNKEVVGIRYSVDAAKALSDNGALMGYFHASYSDYPNRSFDRWIGDAGVLISFKKNRALKLRLGLEESFYAGDHLYEFPYISFILFPKPSHQFQINSELKIGKFRVPAARHYDATNLSLTTKLAKKLTDNVLSTGNIYLEKSSATEDIYSYYGGSAGASLHLLLFKEWKLKPYVSIGRRLYEGQDPFFGKTRHDTRKTAGISLKASNLNLFGLTPELCLSYEENLSNIDYYSYDKVRFTFNLR
ncbi:MAG: DUF560 domain-containing protein [Desulfuromonadales bacterium]|nr:DUF560 domain-containing protein [Desulfuromonadales bacterium]